jgi:hypothetical protein
MKSSESAFLLSPPPPCGRGGRVYAMPVTAVDQELPFMCTCACVYVPRLSCSHERKRQEVCVCRVHDALGDPPNQARLRICERAPGPLPPKGSRPFLTVIVILHAAPAVREKHLGQQVTPRH